MQKNLLPELRNTLDGAIRADFCVGYVNLRGWRSIEDKIEQFAGTEDARCRLLVGMQALPKDELQSLLSLSNEEDRISLNEVSKIKRRYVEEFRSQLTYGAPNNQDEAALRRLSAQLKAGKVTVKLFARHTLHAKLYLVYVPEKTPRIAFLGSSNLTLSGLSKQGELNIDVNDHVATETLETWFEDKWTDKFCVDISQELAEIIDESWAKEELTPPYHIYLKMVYHLSQEARAGMNEYRLPKEFKLFDFQAAAVKIAARHVNRRGGVIIADVRSLKAFDFSQEPDDWRDLMRLFMVRRTRSFIKNNYAEPKGDPTARKYLEFPDGTRSYFPNRIPKTAKFSISSDKEDLYSLLYSDRVVDVINALNLPRYGLGNFAIDKPVKSPTEAEQKILDSLSRAGKRLMGFCRTNLFKRLESSGIAFLQSIDRHILRNYIFLHAIDNDLDIPIGTQDAAVRS